MKDKLKIIVGLLINKTQSREVSWSKLNDYAYVLNFAGNKIVINNYFISFREERKVNFIIYNQNDEILCDISEDKDKNIKTLYNLANDNYYNIDETINNIIKALM